LPTLCGGGLVKVIAVSAMKVIVSMINIICHFHKFFSQVTLRW